MKMESNWGDPRSLLIAVGIALSLFATGCSTTVESQPEAAKAVESGGPLPPSVTSFFGPDASKLAPGPKGGAALVWINPNVQWANYNKILLDPVQFWAAADSKVSTSDQQVLTEYFYNSLKTNIPQQGFTLVESAWARSHSASGCTDGCDHSSSRPAHDLRGRSAGARAESRPVHGH